MNNKISSNAVIPTLATNVKLRKQFYLNNTSFKGDITAFTKTAIKALPLKVKCQRLLYNKCERISMPFFQNSFSLINGMERSRIDMRKKRNINLDPTDVKSEVEAVKSRVEEYCKLSGSKFIAPVKLFSKNKGKEVEGSLILRKIDPNINYSELKSNCESGKLINKMIDSRINSKGISLESKLFGFPQDHFKINKNSHLLEILDDSGLSVAYYFLDINKLELLDR